MIKHKLGEAIYSPVRIRRSNSSLEIHFTLNNVMLSLSTILPLSVTGGASVIHVSGGRVRTLQFRAPARTRWQAADILLRSCIYLLWNYLVSERIKLSLGLLNNQWASSLHSPLLAWVLNTIPPRKLAVVGLAWYKKAASNDCPRVSRRSFYSRHQVVP